MAKRKPSTDQLSFDQCSDVLASPLFVSAPVAIVQPGAVLRIPERERYEALIRIAADAYKPRVIREAGADMWMMLHRFDERVAGGCAQLERDNWLDSMRELSLSIEGMIAEIEADRLKAVDAYTVLFEGAK